MGYNVYVDRTPDGAYDYWAFVIEGNGVFYHKTMRVTRDTKTTKSALFSYVEEAFRQIAPLFEYKTIPAAEVTFMTSYRTMAAYFAHFLQDDKNALKPPKKYYNEVHSAFTAMESLGVMYSVQFAQWANKAKIYASERYYREQKPLEVKKRQKARDVFADMNIVEDTGD